MNERTLVYGLGKEYQEHKDDHGYIVYTTIAYNTIFVAADVWNARK